jgi:hypothetical protein
MFYKMNGKEIIACANQQEWYDWLLTVGEERILAEDHIGDFLVLTVFDGWDPFDRHGAPQLMFETKVYDGKGDVLFDLGDRYATWALAEVGHHRSVLRIRGQL